jgi:hypothetical protein
MMTYFRLPPFDATPVRIVGYLGVLVCLLFATPSHAADRARIEAFLSVTGFDVALDSIAFAAGSAPDMLGFDPEEFGSDWSRLTEQVFDTEVMHEIALDILEATLADDLLTHAAGFYATDLGQRLVVAENASHSVADDTEQQREGQGIVDELAATDAPRLKIFKRMNRAIDASGNSLRALQEIQMRFLMAASAAGVIELQLDPDALRALLEAQEPEMRRALEQSSLASSAYTYRDFTDADLLAYVEALEDPRMQRVYELLNAVQFEIMAGRFEVLAGRMAELQPGQDI